MSAASLQVQLECELPPALEVGGGSALFVCGWCFCPTARIDSVSLVFNGTAQPVIAHGMPRLDPFRALHPGLDPFATAGLTNDPHSPVDPLLHSYRSGFWGIVRIEAGAAPGEAQLSLRAELASGEQVTAPLGTLSLTTAPQALSSPWPTRGDGAPVAICMATFNPPQDLFERQLDSIRAQSHSNWVCVISDDCSHPERYAAIKRAISGDERFVLSRSARRLGFYRNFERALALAPRQAQYVALADQDDVWHTDKLETLLAALGTAQLVYSDARVVSRTGELISETWWSTRRNNHTRLLSLLVANAVTGAASLLRRDMLDIALPFPPGQFAHFHDHWLGLTALALGDIAYVDRALYDYVQHGEAALGHAAANQMISLRDRVRHQRGARERARLWRLHYFVDVCRLLQFATVLELRCERRMTAAKRRALGRFIATDRSLLALASLGLRGARELLGSSETLGAEWMLFHAFAWRRLLALSARDRPQARLRLDAVPPPSLVQEPGRAAAPAPAGDVAAKIAPLALQISDDAPSRINILIPAIDLQHFFGGYIAKLNLAQRLSEWGLRVRIVTVDPVGALPSDWQRRLEAYGGLAGLFERVEVVFGRESAGIEVSRSDSFIATTWWTAHLAQAATRALDSERFVYLIQEYEPFTFPMGTYAALARASYDFPHFALFSSELLRAYFRVHAIGVYSSGVDAGDSASIAFEHAITAVDPPNVEELAQRATRRLLFYARPEPHAARNMFELGVLALARAAQDGAIQGNWELNGVGTVGRSERVPLGSGAWLTLTPRSDERSYASLLRAHDVGLALMYTPHPSLVPIEMAASGLLTVTNCFENKTAAAMGAISSNLITVEPSIEGVVDGLRRATAGAQDSSRRLRGTDVSWSRTWEEAFDKQLMGRLIAALGRPDLRAR